MNNHPVNQLGDPADEVLTARGSIPLPQAGHPLTVWGHQLLLVALVLAVYFCRLDKLTIRGEESRRATVGMEMIATGDWIVPRQQGNPFFMSARPPLQSWLMAGLGQLRGQVDTVAVRLPSVVAILLITLLVYNYGRTFLSPAGAVAAGAAYATMGQVMQLGRLGETDALFTLFVSSSLLLWHWGYSKQWNPVSTWGLAWLCVALGTLTKGLQAPIYFVAPVGAYLLITRRWRFAFSWAHLAGWLVFAVVWGAWQWPFWQRMGIPGVRHIYTGDIMLYVGGDHWKSVFKHLAIYPFAIIGSLLPWSLFFGGFFLRDIRAGIKTPNQNFLFLTVSLIVTFPTVWLVPGAPTRFYMALYPCLALLIGLVIDACGQRAGGQAFWRMLLAGFAVLIAATGVVILVGSLLKHHVSMLNQSPGFAIGFVCATSALAIIAWWASRHPSDRGITAGVFSLAAFAGLLYAGVVVNNLAGKSEHAAEAVHALQQKLPADARLVSYGPTHHLFAYHYGKLIPQLPVPVTAAPDDGVTYFCSETEPAFPYEELGRIVCDRNRSAHPMAVVIVGRRIRNGNQPQASPPPSS